MKQVVVVGAGQAGAALAFKLRAEGFDGAITLIGSEAVPPYQRPRLSKDYLMGKLSVERLLLRPHEFFAKNEITLCLDAEATAIDRTQKRVVLSGGESIPYDALAMTTGARPRRLPAALGGELEGVFTLRTLADADRLRHEMRPGQRALVIGGGYIGLEAAAVFAGLGLEVTVLERADRILQRVACKETSDWFRSLHDAHGVRIREGVDIVRLLGDERVTGALLRDGSVLDADLVIVGIGIEPSTDLAERAGLRVDNGICTDIHARTSDPHIWAAGDCASSIFEGRSIRLESVGNAIDQAEIAALGILGRAAPYVPAPWFWSDQYDCKLQIVGLALDYDTVHVRLSTGGRSHWYYRGERLIAVDSIDDGRAYMTAKRLIAAGISPPPSHVVDASTPLASLLPR